MNMISRSDSHTENYLIVIFSDVKILWLVVLLCESDHQISFGAKITAGYYFYKFLALKLKRRSREDQKRTVWRYESDKNTQIS